MQSFSDSRPRDIALIPIIVAIPPIDDVDAMHVVAHVQQHVDRLADAAAKIEHPRTSRQSFTEPFKKAQVCADGLASLVASHTKPPGQTDALSAMRSAVRQRLSARSIGACELDVCSGDRGHAG